MVPVCAMPVCAIRVPAKISSRRRCWRTETVHDAPQHLAPLGAGEFIGEEYYLRIYGYTLQHCHLCLYITSLSLSLSSLKFTYYCVLICYLCFNMLRSPSMSPTNFTQLPPYARCPYFTHIEHINTFQILTKWWKSRASRGPFGPLLYVFIFIYCCLDLIGLMEH